MMRLVAATNNSKKLIELRRILTPAGFSILSLADVGLEIEPEESAASFAGNARMKAQAVFERCALPTVSDDSGLCVDALGGRPGVYSARYGGDGLDDAGRVRLLLEEMKDVPPPQRGARYVCAICCVLSRDVMLECAGTCMGSIAFSPSGSGGFGYDPVFLVPDAQDAQRGPVGQGRSYSRLTDDEKDDISHRGIALRHLCEMLKDCPR